MDFKQLVPAECYELLQHVWDLIDGQLTDEKTAELERHLDDCTQCRKYKLFQEQFLEALARARALAGAPPSVRTRVLKSLVDAGFSETV